mmetsp:Transcript_13078/g.18729  ORF Transcript_13078/g.18729 Transcript_13078/m.18729 type:complete len:210 (+) Transcript_13078:580-1209(+)
MLSSSPCLSTKAFFSDDAPKHDRTNSAHRTSFGNSSNESVKNIATSSGSLLDRISFVSHSHRLRLKLGRNRPSLLRERISRDTKSGFPFVLWYITFDKVRVSRGDRRRVSETIAFSVCSPMQSSLILIPPATRMSIPGNHLVVESLSRIHARKKKFLCDEGPAANKSWFTTAMDAVSAHCKSSRNNVMGTDDELDITSTNLHNKYCTRF